MAKKYVTEEVLNNVVKELVEAIDKLSKAVDKLKEPPVNLG